MRRALVASVAAALALSAAACSSETGSTEERSTTSTAGTTTEVGRPISDARLDQVAPATDVAGPITGGKYGVPYLAMPEGWEEDYGYTEEEYFLSGQATSYAVIDDDTGDLPPELPSDGEWTATERDPDTPAPYTTRVVVRRPIDDADFNGTLVVEWLNTTAGRDSDPDFGYLATELLEGGFAYMSVSAQKIGVEPGGLGIDVPGVNPVALAPLKTWDPERYGDLSHPGDAYSYDIFGQAARTALEPGDDGVLRGLPVTRVIAMGESQSAFRLTTYVNAVQPLTEMFDGFLIHSRGSASAPLNDEQKPKGPTFIRGDLDAPVLQFESETDLELFGFVDARQPDTDRIASWEAAGTAHADQSTLDYAILAGQRWAKGASLDLSATCGQINDGPMEPVFQQSFAALHTWVAEGTAPPSAPPIETEGRVIQRDADGLALGGIRTPAVDAPIAELSGTNTSPDYICTLFGSQTPFTPEQLAAHYTDHDDYVAQVTASAEQAVDEGFLSQDVADTLIADATNANIP